MQFREWCGLAQDDQNTAVISHLFANYRHSISQAIIADAGMRSFKKALNHHTADPRVRDGNGPSNLAVNQAHKIQYRGRTVPRTDFRLAGRPIKVNSETVLINVARLAPSMASSGRSISGLKPTLADVQLVWLTTIDEFVERLTRLYNRIGDIDRVTFFAEIVALLGLKPARYAETLYAIDMFKPQVTRVLRRPHAFSDRPPPSGPI